MTTVHIRQAVYAYPAIRTRIFEMLSSPDAPDIRADARVLIKPNWLAPAHPEMAMTTHPLVVKAACEFALARGARVQVSDSPAVGRFSRLLRIGGYAEALADLEVIVKPFEATVPVNVGSPFGTIDVAADAMSADAVINLAKLKTHAQMRLTLGVKNLFGCIVGVKKPEWHMRAGVDRKMFARLIVGICQAVSPAYTIVDGILGMEGQGPGKSGTPRQIGRLVGGANPHAVDYVICKLLGLAPERLQTQRSAREMGVFDGRVRIDGPLDAITDFQFPELVSMTTGPDVVGRFLRRHLIQRPVADGNACNRCGECRRYCPAKAIFQDDHGITFDTGACIRCYCCLEVCPNGAIRAITPPAGRVMDWIRAARHALMTRR